MSRQFKLEKGLVIYSFSMKKSFIHIDLELFDSNTEKNMQIHKYNMCLFACQWYFRMVYVYIFEKMLVQGHQNRYSSVWNTIKQINKYKNEVPE